MGFGYTVSGFLIRLMLVCSVLRGIVERMIKNMEAIYASNLLIDEQMETHLLDYVDKHRRLSMEFMWIHSLADFPVMQAIAFEYKRAYPSRIMPDCFVPHAVEHGRLISSPQKEWDGFLDWMGENCAGFWLIDGGSLLFSNIQDATLYALWNPFHRD